MTPLEYYNLYRNLAVSLVDGTKLFGIDVHEYRNAKDVFATDGSDNISADHDASDGWHIAWAALHRKIRDKKHGRKLGGGRYELLLPPSAAGAAGAGVAAGAGDAATPAVQVKEIVNVTDLARSYTGKGTPESIATCLRLAVAYGLVQPTKAAVSSYVSAYIGLDCSGFVGCYLRATGSTRFGPNTPAKSFAPEDLRHTRIDQVAARSVICWKNAGHVAIIDRVEPPAAGSAKVGVWVCESTGAQLVPGDVHTDGMNHTRYEIVSVEGGVFKVKRGLGGSGLNSVYIAKAG